MTLLSTFITLLLPLFHSKLSLTSGGVFNQRRGQALVLHTPHLHRPLCRRAQGRPQVLIPKFTLRLFLVSDLTMFMLFALALLLTILSQVLFIRATAVGAGPSQAAALGDGLRAVLADVARARSSD